MDRERYIPSFEELRRECRQRWAEVRADWKDMLDEAAGFREHGDDEFADMALETAKELRHKMRWVAAARVRRAARETTAEKAVPCSAWVGAQTWTVEKPRASGMWWWWNLDPRCAPDMVEVRANDVLDYMGFGPTMHWPGLTRVRNVMVVGGVWAGPVEPPKLPDAQSAPTNH